MDTEAGGPKNVLPCVPPAVPFSKQEVSSAGGTRGSTLRRIDITLSALLAVVV